MESHLPERRSGGGQRISGKLTIEMLYTVADMHYSAAVKTKRTISFAKLQEPFDPAMPNFLIIQGRKVKAEPFFRRELGCGTGTTYISLSGGGFALAASLKGILVPTLALV